MSGLGRFGIKVTSQDLTHKNTFVQDTWVSYLGRYDIGAIPALEKHIAIQYLCVFALQVRVR